MTDCHFEEVVYLFVDGQVTSELRYSTFEHHVERRTAIRGAPAGATLCRAGFAVVGPELRVHGLVFFLLQLDDAGRPDKDFNIPLPYLAKNAGPGPDLGYGRVPMACRGSCSVPWHANNLWDPTMDPAANPMDALVAAVQNNRLQLNPVPLPEVSAEPVAFDVGHQIAELSAMHTQTLLTIQHQHEEELSALRDILQAKLEVHQQEIVRLRRELSASRQRPGDDAVGYQGY